MYLAGAGAGYLNHACLVENAAAPIPNAKDHADDITDIDGTLEWTFDELSDRAQDFVTHIQASSTLGTPRGDAEAPGAAAVVEGTSRRLCTESQLTFTVPPTTPPFYVRFRLEVNGKKEQWVNPLTWSDGFFFSPVLRGPSGRHCLPPPMLLSSEWEKANVEGKWAWQEQVTRPQEGELRLYTLSGLMPSVETSGFSGWLVGKAGQGLYGTRSVELQFADARDASWEDTAEADWSLLPPLRYRLPSVDIGTAALTLALNWGRCIGVQKMQETLVTEFGRKNRKANLRMIHDFALDTYEKLVPVWHSSVEPWLAQNPTLAIFVPERRDQMLRRRVVELLNTMRYRGLIEGIPPSLIPLRPTLLSLKCIVQGAAVDTSTWVEIPEGQGLTLNAEAIPTTKTGSTAQDMKLWWLVPQANEPGLDMAALLGHSADMLAGPGGRVRHSSPALAGDAACSELQLPGRNRWGNAMVEAGTEFVVRVVAEEPRAHEDDFKDVRVRVVPGASALQSPEVLQRERSRTRGASIDDIPDAEAPYRRTPPRVWGLVKPSAEIAADFQAKVSRCGSIREAAEAVLAELGFTPTEADIAEVVGAVSKSDAETSPEEKFRAWYKDSVFGQSLLSEGWWQAQNTLRERRNRFLAETLEIPKDRWGFKDDEWGGIFPEMGLMQQHLACISKAHMASVWNSRDTTRKKRRAESMDEKDTKQDNGAGSSASAPAPPVHLDVPESVDKATLLAVTEALAGGMAKQYMSKLLPAASFGEEERKAWVSESAAERTLAASTEQVLTYRLAEYYRFQLSEETAAARDAREAAAAKREQDATDWMEAYRTRGTNAGSPPDSTDLGEVMKVVAKTAVKQEITRFVEKQLVPLVQTQLREHLLPAVVDTLKSVLSELVQKRWLSLGLAGIAVGSVLTVSVVGPWVAVFYLLRKQSRLH